MNCSNKRKDEISQKKLLKLKSTNSDREWSMNSDCDCNDVVSTNFKHHGLHMPVLDVMRRWGDETMRGRKWCYAWLVGVWVWWWCDEGTCRCWRMGWVGWWCDEGRRRCWRMGWVGGGAIKESEEMVGWHWNSKEWVGGEGSGEKIEWKAR